jgi:hypothetical protein
MEFDIVNDLLNLDNLNLSNPIYIDTDSLFVTLPVSLENETSEALSYIDKLQTSINNSLIPEFLKLHNIKIREKEETPLLNCVFKNEYMIKSMALYAKKRYISVIIKQDKTGKIYYDVDLKGVEGKRATNKFIKLFVDELLEYLKTLDNNTKIYNKFDIYTNVIKKYKDMIYSRVNNNIYENIEFFSLPINVNKKISDLKNVAGYYKGTFIFDIITNEEHWGNKTGKGKWISVKLKDESCVPRIMSEFNKYPQIKTANKKVHDIIRDITIPDSLLQKDNDAVEIISKYFDINYDVYFETLLKKIKLLYNPFDVQFCNNLLKNNNTTLPKNYTIFGTDFIYIKE